MATIRYNSGAFQVLTGDIKLCIMRLLDCNQLSDVVHRMDVIRKIVKIWKVYSDIPLKNVPAEEFEFALDNAVSELWQQGFQEEQLTPTIEACLE